MTKLLVMTDLHLTPGAERIIGVDPLERFHDALQHAARYQPDADRLILTGDLTNNGDAVSYQKLADALTGCPWPVDFLLGNLDYRGAFRTSFPDCATDPNGFVQSVVDLGHLRLITLDTLDEEGAVVEDAGYLCPSRLEWLAHQLRNTGDRPCLLFLHHPPLKTGFHAMDGIRLLNDDAFWKVVQSGPVAHILAGHLHRNVTATVGEIPVTIFKSTCFQMPMKLGAKGYGEPVDDRGGYGIVIADSADIVVHFEDLSPSA